MTELRTLFKALSAERRAMRAAGVSADLAIRWQTEASEPIRYRRTLRLHTAEETALAIRQWDAQDRRCYLCGRRLFYIGTREHVVPRSKGGEDHLNTLRSHGDCNVEKAHRLPYPCELLYLDAINLKLGLTDDDYTPPVRPFLKRRRLQALGD